ncbi:MAG TPA: SCP2 sterol-binding domain-containing protein [Candidatus Acidoferrum sp.]|nr:SCP2 sterol-binding domain-containing protein [Candidatus Acidoferrum sp.]
MSFALLQSAMLLPLELAVNQVLALDATSAGKLAALEGNALAIESKQPAATFFITVAGGKLRLSPRYEGTTTATLSGSPTALLRLLLKREAVTSLHDSGLELRGNTGFVQALQNVLLGLRIDWEFQLSLVLGDIPTQLLADGVHKSQSYLHRTADRVRRDVGDFLLEEGRLVPAPDELEKFYADVQSLALRLDRLEAGLAHLARRS